ncbi:MAG: hypothetical protein IPH74_00820 [Bacteroidetes bacterium]|nr:hypothetical protein [Bacteroidota bacterium]
MNSATTVTLCEGSTTRTGNGTWTIVNGCLEFTADETVGRDTICVVACDASTGICDTTVYIIDVLPLHDTIRDTLYINDSTTVCDALFENGVDGTIVSSTLCDGSTNSSSQYGSWTADGDGCISYNSNDIVGYNLDTICVVTIDEDGDIDTTIYIISILPRPDTIRDTVCQNCVETYCPELENGMNPATTTVTLCDGSTAGTGNGTWTIVNGCLEFTADETVGRDTICVVACDASTGICDTTVYIIDVLPLKDTIRDTLYINDSTTVCDAIFENGVDGTIVSSTLCDGSTNSSSQYGSWTADGDGCISYNSNDIVGYNLDTICVVTIDEDGDIDTTIYIISILPRPDTIRDTVCQNCTETYCPELENGMNPATTTVTLCDGSTTGTGNGVWSIVNGCLEFTADETVGRDTICVVACDASTGICDTTVYIIDVLPLKDTIRDTLYINDSTTVCDAIFENSVNGTIVSSTYVMAATNSSSQYGSWTADGDGCISYNSNDIVGYNLDTICVVTIDEDGDIDTTIYIISILPRPDTIRDTVCQNCVETYCPVLENGMNPATTTITLCDGSTTGTGNGTWTIVNGCLEFTADETVGRDTICVVACDASTGICDTTVYIIDVLPLHDTIRDTLYINDSTTVCDAIFENSVNGTIVSSTLCDGSTNSSSQYGSWTADGDGCISYNSNDIVGYNLDTICVVTIDEDGDIDTTIYIISILPRPDTIRDTVCQNCVETYCPELENGMNPATTTVTLCDGSTTGTGNGTWTIVNGCLEFTADETVGRDTICVVACDASTGICDTTVYIIDVLPSMHDTIYGILPTDSTIIVCDLMFENGTTTNIVNSEICGGGDSGFSQYGNWTVNGDGCITYNSYQKVGIFVDYICVATEDEDGNRDTTIFIISIYPRPDTIRDTVCQNCTETYCPVLEDGMNPATTTVTLCDGSTAGTGNGSWTIVNGCLEFTADQTVGRDTICVVACDASSGICDTTVYIIDVLPLKDTIRDTLYINDSTTVCDLLFENSVNGTIISSTLCDGSTANSSLYGNWIIDGDGCITYYSNDISGNEVDTICVVTIDEDGDIDSTIFIISILPRANIGNYVWSDLDGDGVQEDGEPGIEGVLVYLIDGITGDTLRSTTTDVNGLYLFTNVPQGSYQVGFDVSGVSGNYVGTIQNAGGDDNVDSDADSNTGLTGVFNFDPTNGDDLSVDAGFMPQANIGNYVWSDLDGDGVQEDGEPGIGVLVLIDGITGDTLRSTTTDVNGLYLFTNVPQGSYQVGFDVSGVSGNYVGTIQNAGGDDNVDSDADSNTGLTGVFNFDPTNGDDLSVDAGFIPQANIGNYVWSDLDGDGVQEDGEPGIEGVLVYLIDGITGDTLRSTTTDVNGLYLFTNVPQGSYQVGFDVSGVSGNYVGTIQNAGGDDNVDSDADSNTGLTGVFNFDPTNGDDLSVDAGFIPQANIGNYVWSDLDGDGVQEDGEPGIEGVLVYLIDGITGDTLRSTTTDVNGLYLFTNVPQAATGRF